MALRQTMKLPLEIMASAQIAMRCRNGASITFLLVGVVPLGALLGGALGEAIGPRGALLAAGAGVLLIPGLAAILASAFVAHPDS